MNNLDDKTRDHLANERTFLAWIRTSIAIIAFGFVVSKFGITLREFFFIQNRVVKNENVSLNEGVGFIAIGILIAIIPIGNEDVAALLVACVCAAR